MNTHSLESAPATRVAHESGLAIAQRCLPLAGRALFSAIFISSSFGHFTRKTIEFAAAQGVPLANLAVPLSGVIALVGGLCILLGYRARLGAWLVVLFLVPVTLTMHAFWNVQDPAQAQVQQIMFMKNVTILGAALMIAYFGSGPLSLDAPRPPSTAYPRTRS